MRRLKTGIRIGMVLVPLVAAGGAVVAPPSVGTACGCSGGPNLEPEPGSDAPGWHSFLIGVPRLLGTNGVIPIWGDVVGLGEQELLASVEFALTDAAGADVPGQLEYVAPTLLVWRPDAELSPDTLHTIRASVLTEYRANLRAPELEFELTTAPGRLGAIVPPMIGSLFLERYTRLVGAPVSCTVEETVCGEVVDYSQLEFSGQEEAYQSVRVDVTDDDASDAWHPLEYRVVVTAGEPTNARESATQYRRTFSGWWEPESPDFHFQDSEADFCFSLTGKSLATGDTFETEPVCIEGPPGSEWSSLDAHLRRCIESPTAALQERWCELNVERCAADAGPEGLDAGAAVDAGRDGAGEPVEDPATSEAPVGKHRRVHVSGSSCATAVGRASATSGGIWAAIVAVGLLVRRRRRLWGPLR